jgi:hypothetical protein
MWCQNTFPTEEKCDRKNKEQGSSDALLYEGGERNSITLLQVFPTPPARPSLRSSMKIRMQMTLEW